MQKAIQRGAGMKRKVNVDIQKEGFVDIELKEGKKITLSEVDMDGRLLSCKGSQIVLYILGPWRRCPGCVGRWQPGTQVSCYFLPDLEGDEERWA